MKFKTKEKLIKKYTKNIGYEHQQLADGIKQGIELSFESFKERVNFYKKYKSEFYLFEKEQKELCNEYLERFIVRISDTWLEDYFNAWLFDKCFGDIK